MNKVFLGPLVHWAIVVALVALGWVAGAHRFHVSTFNPFLILLLVVAVAVLLIVLWTSPPGRDVTRDPIADEHEDQG